MMRITKKLNKPYVIDNNTIMYYWINSSGLNMANKLGKLEDIEERLGCPLEVRERAMDNGVYDSNGKHWNIEHYVPHLKSLHTKGIMTHTEKHFPLKDYKITWWLKKDKSE